MSGPVITIGILSWNRLHYLRATLESARRCIRYPHIHWIISDNESTEPGLRDYIESLDWVQTKVFRRQTHAAAMNEIVAMAGDLVMLWPDDMQFVVEGGWMEDVAFLMTRHADIGSVSLGAVRRATLRALFAPPPRERVRRWLRDARLGGVRPRRSRVVTSERGWQLRTCGAAEPGICGSGIPTITRTAVWRRLGPWRARATAPANLIDSSLGAEDDMVARFGVSGLRLQLAISMIPVAADIVTDPLGCKAKVRGRYRYGVYMPPPEGTFYYRIRKPEELPCPAGGLPLDFNAVVAPLGFHIPADASGDRLKASINTSVVYDLEAARDIRYPLADVISPGVTPRPSP